MYIGETQCGFIQQRSCNGKILRTVMSFLGQEKKNYHVFKADRWHHSGTSSVIYLKYKFTIH